MARPMRPSKQKQSSPRRGRNRGSNNGTSNSTTSRHATPSPTPPSPSSTPLKSSWGNNNTKRPSSSNIWGVVVTFSFLMLVFVYQLSKLPILLVSTGDGTSSWSIMDPSSAGATHISSSNTDADNLLSPAEWNDMLKLRRQGTSSKPEDALKSSSKTTTGTQQQQQALALAALRHKQQQQQQQSINGGTLLLRTDALYQKGTWDKSPIIIEKYNLVFFTVPKVGCTGFKQLFRRMMGHTNWLDHQYYREPFLPHNPSTNGLKYLSDYPFDKANEMLTSPQWTRAIFVRNPDERILSAYLDKAVYSKGYYLRMRCCNKYAPGSEPYNLLQCATGIQHYQAPAPGEKETTPIMSFEDFVTKIIPTCNDPHWEPQATRMAPKYWNTINFVGQFENLFDDTKRLLSQLKDNTDTGDGNGSSSNAWEDYGSKGWIVNGVDGAMFDPKQKAIHGTKARDHSSKTSHLTPKAKESIQQYYYHDYHHSVMSFIGSDNPQQQQASSSPPPPPPQQQEQQRKPLSYTAGATVTRDSTPKRA